MHYTLTTKTTLLATSLATGLMFFMPCGAMEHTTQNLDEQLIEAAENGVSVEVERLLLAGANVNIADFFGQTALHYAVQESNTTTIQVLLTAPDIKVNLADSSGNTPLHYAAKHGDLAIVQTLLTSTDINVNLANNFGETALYNAAENGHTTTVQELLAAPGINVNATDTHGLTALHLAAWNGRTATVQKLLATPGINVNAINKKKQSPLDLALEAAIATLLRNRGGRTSAELCGPDWQNKNC